MRLSPESQTVVSRERSLMCRPGDAPRAPSDLEAKPSQPRTPGRKDPLHRDLTEKTCLFSTFSVSCVWQEASARGAWQVQKHPGLLGTRPLPTLPGGDTRRVRMRRALGWAAAQHPESETPALASAPRPLMRHLLSPPEPILPLLGGPSPGRRLWPQDGPNGLHAFGRGSLGMWL